MGITARDFRKHQSTDFLRLLSKIGGYEWHILHEIGYYGPFRIDFSDEVWYDVYFTGSDEWESIPTEELVYTTRDWKKCLYFLWQNEFKECVTDMAVFHMPDELIDSHLPIPDHVLPGSIALCDSRDDHFYFQHNYGAKKRKPNN